MADRYSAVIFDLDGTLLDTLRGIAEAGNRVLGEHGVATLATDDYRQYVGDGVRRLFERVLPEPRRDEETIRQCCDDFRAVYRHQWHVGTHPYEGVEELLAELAARQVRMAVLSNKPDEFARECVREYFAEGMFEAVLGDRDGTAPKPDPAGAKTGRRTGCK